MRQLQVKLKAIRRIKTTMKYVKSQIKNPNFQVLTQTTCCLVLIQLLIRQFQLDEQTLFKKINMAFSIISIVVTTIIQLRNTPSINIIYSHQTFTSHFLLKKNSTISCLQSAMTIFPDSMLISLTKKYTPPQTRSGGLR